MLLKSFNPVWFCGLIFNILRLAGDHFIASTCHREKKSAGFKIDPCTKVYFDPALFAEDGAWSKVKQTILNRCCYITSTLKRVRQKTEIELYNSTIVQYNYIVPQRL